MNQKDIGIVILAIAVIVLAGVAYYLYSGVNKCKAMAIDLGAQLVECGAGVEQLQAGLDECTTQATQCRQALISLQQLCAPYLSTEQLKIMARTPREFKVLVLNLRVGV